MIPTEVKDLLDYKAAQYNNPSFIESDPVSIPHGYGNPHDIEISGFLAATIAWGGRKSAIASAKKMMHLMDDAPHDFVLNHSDDDLASMRGFVHRTFNADDLVTMIKGLRKLYGEYGGMEHVFKSNIRNDSLHFAIHEFRNILLSVPHEQRFRKHIADPMANSAAKRIHLFLRWMVRRDKCGVDLGIWKSIPMSVLSCPLDVHSGRTARALGLLQRSADDRKAVEELDSALRTLDPLDPSRYDFALFGLGIENSGFRITPHKQKVFGAMANVEIDPDVVIGNDDDAQNKRDGGIVSQGIVVREEFGNHPITVGQYPENHRDIV